jgi:hypothetical protein
MNAAMSKKIFILLLSSAILSTSITVKAADDLNLSREQKTGLFLIQKLYGPIKKRLTDLNAQLITLENSIVSIAKLTQEEKIAQTAKIKKALGKKLIKIEKALQTLNEIKQAINRCPLSLKTDQAQQAITTAGIKYLGYLKPALIEQRVNDLQTKIENILNSIK